MKMAITTSVEGNVSITEPHPVEPKQALADAIGREARQGWHVESQSDMQATLVKGKPTNHLLHVVLCVLTLGLWIPIWILIAILSGQKHELLTVQPSGLVLKTKS